MCVCVLISQFFDYQSHDLNYLEGNTHESLGVNSETATAKRPPAEGLENGVSERG